MSGLDEQECIEYYHDTGLGVFYAYDDNEQRWNLVVNMKGHYYIDELGWITTECPIKEWWPN